MQLFTVTAEKLVVRSAHNIASVTVPLASHLSKKTAKAWVDAPVREVIRQNVDFSATERSESTGTYGGDILTAKTLRSDSRHCILEFSPWQTLIGLSSSERDLLPRRCYSRCLPNPFGQSRPFTIHQGGPPGEMQ